MKNVFVTMLFGAHLAISVWLANAEGWGAGVTFFFLFAVVTGLLLKVHDAVSRIGRKSTR